MLATNVQIGSFSCHYVIGSQCSVVFISFAEKSISELAVVEVFFDFKQRIWNAGLLTAVDFNLLCSMMSDAQYGPIYNISKVYTANLQKVKQQKSEARCTSAIVCCSPQIDVVGVAQTLLASICCEFAVQHGSCTKSCTTDKLNRNSKACSKSTTSRHVEMLCSLLHDSFSIKLTTNQSSGFWPLVDP